MIAFLSLSVHCIIFPSLQPLIPFLSRFHLIIQCISKEIGASHFYQRFGGMYSVFINLVLEIV